MPGRSSNSGGVRLLGAVVAAIAVCGYVVLDWQFGGAGAPLPQAIGLGVAILAIGVTLSRWVWGSSVGPVTERAPFWVH